MPQSYIPKRQDLFYSWQDNYMNVVNANSVSWSVPPAELTALQTLQTAYVNAFQLGSKEQKTLRTAGHVRALQIAAKAFVDGIRKFTARWLANNPLVTDAQKKDMDITVRDTIRTRIAAVNFAPELAVEKIGFGLHTLRIRNPENPRSKAMPKGQRVILRTAIGAANIPELQIPWSYNTQTVKKFLHTVFFQPSDKGKTAYYCAHYESNRGERGPSSAVVDAIIA